MPNNTEMEVDRFGEGSAMDGLPDIPICEVGEVVWDDLMRCPAVVVRTERDGHGNIGVYLSTAWLDGGRLPWEISVYYRETE